MKFYLGNSENFTNAIKKNIISLYLANWDDWFEFSTLYRLYYYDEDGKVFNIGSIKVGQIGMTTRTPNIENEFDYLSEDFFSVGQDVSYYEALNDIGDDFRYNILKNLRDIALDPDIYKIAVRARVTKVSLLRSVSTVSAEGQYRRLANGIAQLTPYNFNFTTPRISKISSVMNLEFNVLPKSNPPTNIHVIIGRNGVGKTHLFNNMISSLIDDNASKSKVGYFKTTDNNEKIFANLVSVSFSAFDETSLIQEKKDKTTNINYAYIGLKRINSTGIVVPKSPTILKNEFVKSVEKCRLGAKNDRWVKALEMLEADPIFKEAELSEIAKTGNDQNVKEVASHTFAKLSSGHKIVLLTITRLVESIEERSLVLLDEPEGYLHPPLLSAFIRALSDLLIKRNAVAIIGTHSPVVLQEVPKNVFGNLDATGPKQLWSVFK